MVRALIELRPSNILYTQDSIKNTFTFQHEGTPIGETLDDLCNGVCDICDIPPIRVSFQDGRYWSGDNRRLWVFRQFERLGGCDKIRVKEVNWSAINPDKFTTENGGVEVRVRGYRGDPGGSWHRRPDNFLRRQNQSSRRARHGVKVHSFDNNVVPPVILPPTSPPQPTTAGRQPTYGKLIHQAFVDPYDYGHRTSPLCKPVRPTSTVSPPAHAQTPIFQPTPSNSTWGFSGREGIRMNTARDTIIDIAAPYSQIPRDEIDGQPESQHHKKSKKRSCCVIC
ncbi:uncharacterized protein LOC135462865 [Liolophura sinensis]|uniref:uncharacterized protein LOC135462865 n=1 Tax=Liolophura sinensis TaxID=3198878 RepID=UPI00315895BC